MKSVEKWTKRLRFFKISKYIIIISFFLSITIIGLTYYGSNSGNFLITIERQSVKNLSLSESLENFQTSESGSARLFAEGMDNLTHATLNEHIPPNIDQMGEGSHNDKPRYFAYTFYLKNVSGIAVNYRAQLVIREVSKIELDSGHKIGVDSAIRVMAIRNGEREIYAKPQEFENIGQPETNGGEYGVKNFFSQTVVFDFEVNAFEPLAIDKYTVVMWLEGNDEQCIDEIKGGKLKMELRFFTL
ncbi:MAG: hypothetical protein PHE12_04115 [Clostridia bacterium]|nr:hypothetical protein [Clostridia bacterium]